MGWFEGVRLSCPQWPGVGGAVIWALIRGAGHHCFPAERAVNQASRRVLEQATKAP